MRFISYGDNAYGYPGQRAVGFHAYKSPPDVAMTAGDDVHGSGRNTEYIKYISPTYKPDIRSATVGAPLLRSVPFYTVIANPDVIGKGPNGGPGADFDRNPDALGYSSVMNLPANGPAPPQPTPLVGKAA